MCDQVVGVFTSDWLSLLPLSALVPLQFDDTKEGWRRDGWWERIPNTEWVRGTCNQFYNRTCAVQSKTIDLRVFIAGQPVDDPEAAFRPRWNWTDSGLFPIWGDPFDGRWEERGGECVDYVLNGCFNNGTCVAPNTCKCAPGWEGHDCSLPVCSHTITKDIRPPSGEEYRGTLLRASGVNKGLEPPEDEAPMTDGDKRIWYRQCANRGNCTHPDTCTCEKGWTGPDCSEAMCAQECFNGGNCTAPDTCTCLQWWSRWRDKRLSGGRPIFRKSNGDPINTGWTGFDCNTPICVQAEKWVPNVEVANVTLFQSANDGRSYQAGCEPTTRFTPPNRTRVSEDLCGISVWYQGEALVH